MAEYNKQKHLDQLPDLKDIDQLTIGIVYGAWHEAIVERLLTGAKYVLHQAGLKEDQIKLQAVPGSYEVPLAAKVLIGQHKLDAVITLGCVIKGQTDHDVYINQAVANGLMQLSLVSGVPCIFGILTVNNEQQALDRSDANVKGNKGAHAATAALQMIGMKKQSDDHQPIGFNRG